MKPGKNIMPPLHILYQQKHHITAVQTSEAEVTLIYRCEIWSGWISLEKVSFLKKLILFAEFKTTQQLHQL
jgi:hypothetical protein